MHINYILVYCMYCICSLQLCVIADCGEVPAGEDIMTVTDDGTGDTYSDHPGESNVQFSKVREV